MQVLVAAATWFLVITALTAIATAVPHVVDTFRGGRSERPSSVTSPEPTGRSDLVTDEAPERQQDRCEDAVNGNATENGNGVGTASERRAVRRAGGRSARATTAVAGPTIRGAKGTEDRPGTHGSNGRIRRRVDRRMKGPPMTPVSHGRSDEEHGRSGTSGGREDHGRAGENGRSGQHG